MSKLLFLAAPLMAAGAVAAHAQAPAQASQQKLPPTRTEVVQKLDEGFNRVDTNNDGFLDRNEINAAGTKAVAEAQEKVDEKAQQEFSKLDVDKNGQLSLTEFKAAARVAAKSSPDQALQRLDANKDGRISGAEFKAQMLASFDRVDLNKDGKITPDEATKTQSR